MVYIFFNEISVFLLKTLRQVGGRGTMSVPVCVMEADRLSGGIAPLILQLGFRWMWVVRLSALATLQPQKRLWVGAGPGLDVFQKRQFCCSVQDLNPRSSSIHPSYCTDHAAPYDLKVIQKSIFINWDGMLGLDVFDS